ncbi:hypothetical protein TVAG_485610 [Trichomonas vaginalis G3]|uniref:Uncharacterized protein n=1 Tax=Trichomonas vaginalis (strain ATCC PRA-98 / G3) TaxID=412133 RepID=A2FZS3_TRIV3|nr:hypothetical protein TVAGG3_0507960 [Trichomonas vaginalis G3]EAX89587.1 hypothetical protein TVAG_485610 [Trichomonas vaginalis G3]KAI5517569.1 hypothetical protein TVAGG3_0507960 [Trichomonas vaginalis G3]|eukprot:XP_001302517.1 hypothetical protein [Trichomonas vaginalis G3]
MNEEKFIEVNVKPTSTLQEVTAKQTKFFMFILDNGYHFFDFLPPDTKDLAKYIADTLASRNPEMFKRYTDEKQLELFYNIKAKENRFDPRNGKRPYLEPSVSNAPVVTIYVSTKESN